jgi:ribonuclease-3
LSPVYRWTETSLHYRFRDPVLLGQALKHRSAGGDHNERLEYLGDAVLGFVVAEFLFQALPDADEGYLSRLRASLVRRGTLADIAAGIGLGERVRLGSGELNSGGFRRASILANTLEALFGAIYLDGGLAAVRHTILMLYGGRLEELPGKDQLKDPKTRLQEILQARGLDLPVYDIEQITGDEHRRHFTASCAVAALGLATRGEGASRRKAEQRAAERMVARIGDEHA